LDNPNSAIKFGEMAKKRAKTLFSADKQAQSYYDLYTKIISDSL